MFFHVVCLSAVVCCLTAQSSAPLRSMSQRIELALHHYRSSLNQNPMVDSLLRILVNDRLTKQYMTDEAIQQALDDVKRVDRNDEAILRKFIYKTKPLSKTEELLLNVRDELQSIPDTSYLLRKNSNFQSFGSISGRRSHKYRYTS